MASEVVTLERRVAVARVSGVNGVHRARIAAPRAQDPGFGYFVASLVDALSRDRRFTVWESELINMRATPSLASESAHMILEIGRRRLEGIFHCCGADGIGRKELALLACSVFDLDPGLLDSGPPDPDAMPDVPIPHHASVALDNCFTSTRAVLGTREQYGVTYGVPSGPWRRRVGKLPRYQVFNVCWWERAVLFDRSRPRTPLAPSGARLQGPVTASCRRQL